MACAGTLVSMVVVCCIFLVGSVAADRIRDKIYVDFKTHAGCIRRLNWTHEIGCSSSASGEVGVLHHIRTPEDVNYVTKNGHHSPYIAIINIVDLQFYNVETIRSLEKSGRVRGVIVVKYSDDKLSQGSFSSDKTCPNKGFGLYEEGSDSCGKKDGITWNEAGTGLLFERWNFPIFLLYQNADIDFLLNNCTFRFNQPGVNETVPSWPLCSAELTSFMLAAADSQTCIRRTNLITNMSPQVRCDPLADFNAWATLSPFANDSVHGGTNSTIIVAARMDASGLFEFVPGVESSVSGLVTLMLVAEALAKLRTELAEKNIMFVLFNGEAFDYIGSSRVVYDMQKKEFPQIPPSTQQIGLEDIDFFIELSQLGLVENSKFYLHSDPNSARDADVRDKIERFAAISSEQAESAGIDSIFLNTTQLPPASFQRFLKSGQNVPGVVIADHKKEYTNRFYNSLFDDLAGQNNSYPNNMTDTDAYNYPLLIAVNAQKIATVVARSIYKFITGRATSIEANVTTSSNLVYCYAYHSNCSLFKSYFNGTAAQMLRNSPVGLYISASRSSSPQLLSFLTSRTLTNLVGERVNLTEGECRNGATGTDPLNDYTFFITSDVNGNRTGYCVKANSGLSPAKSPAFLDSDFSGNSSTWTESVWTSTSIRIFLQSDPQEDVNTMTFGLISTVIITGIIFGMSRAAGKIFMASPNES